MSDSPRCPTVETKPFAAGQPFLLRDSHTGLLLYVESDGRHMSAIAQNGKILWHRNLFDDARLARSLVPTGFPGQRPLSTEEWRLWAKSYLNSLSIDRVAVFPDCALHYIDHVLLPQFHGHYIYAASGGHVEYLLDAKTGDFLEFLTN